jgi:putative transposase
MDRVYLQARMEDDAECMLVLIGATPEGKKELVGFQTGVRESAQSWRELLIDIRQRGPRPCRHGARSPLRHDRD